MNDGDEPLATRLLSSASQISNFSEVSVLSAATLVGAATKEELQAQEASQQSQAQSRPLADPAPADMDDEEMRAAGGVTIVLLDPRAPESLGDDFHATLLADVASSVSSEAELMFYSLFVA